MMRTYLRERDVKNEAGFTLVEMLVSLFIFSLITAGTMTAMSSAISTRHRVNQGIETLNKIQAARSIMQTDFDRLSLRQRRDILGSFEPYVFTTDGDALISFTRLGRENPGGLEQRGDAERVEYHFEKNTLIRRSWVTANPDVSAKPRETILLDELQDIRIEFQSGDFAPVSRIAVAAEMTEALPKIVHFYLTDLNGLTSEHVFELRGK